MVDFALLRPGVRPWAGEKPAVVENHTPGIVAPSRPDVELSREMQAFKEDAALLDLDWLDTKGAKRPVPAPVVQVEATPAPVASVIEEAPPEEDFVTPETLWHGASFLYGGAGCGKTYLSRQIVAYEQGVLLCASTGIAAVNLGEGTTINSALGYYDTASLVDKYTSGFLTAQLGKLWKAGVRRIILDEVSMLADEQLTCITRALDELSGRRYTANVMLADEIAAEQEIEGVATEADGARPWPIKLTLVGDFLQLPPVKAKYAFESPEWARYDAHKLELTQIRRQADKDFITALRAARRGDPGPVVDYFRPRLVQGVDQKFQGVTVFARNEEVDRYNALRMDSIPGTPVSFPKTQWGEPRSDWKQIPDALTLKVGALVMVLANAKDTMHEGPRHEAPLLYANGDLGEVVALDNGVARVKLQRTGGEQIILPITRNHEKPLEPGRRAELKAQNKLHLITDNGRFEIVGQVTYVPLRVAFGSTVHKCQGLTMDRVQVNTRDGFFKTPGLLYVALSRARTAEGLRLIGSPDGLKARVTIDPKVKRWV